MSRLQATLALLLLLVLSVAGFSLATHVRLAREQREVEARLQAAAATRKADLEAHIRQLRLDAAVGDGLRQNDPGRPNGETGDPGTAEASSNEAAASPPAPLPANPR